MACFSAHPLINALREEVSVPVIGIMEAALYAARMVGGRFGIIATGPRSKIMGEDAIQSYGLRKYSVGSEHTGLGVLELETKPRDEVLERVGETARRLVEKGADTVLLGCAGMTDMMRKCEEAVGENVKVLDGVVLGVQFLVGLVRDDLGSAKRGLYSSSEEARRKRGQEWL